MSAMSKAAVKISGDLLSNPLCEQDQAFLESMTALDTAMKRMDAFNQEKVRLWLSLGSSRAASSVGGKQNCLLTVKLMSIENKH